MGRPERTVDQPPRYGTPRGTQPEGGYGAAFGSVWRAVLRDYRTGQGRRARARLGLLTPPEGRGRLVWIKVGAGTEALRLGVEILGAVRDRRHDVRIVLTFEADDPELLRSLLRPGLLRSGPAVGIGYGPCDRPRVVRRVLERFAPCGIILVESRLPPNLLRQAQVPVAAVVPFGAAPTVPTDADGTGSSALDADVPGPDTIGPDAIAVVWPRTPQAHGNGPVRVDVVLPPADPQARFAEAQADVVLRSLMGLDATRHLWWWHGTLAQWPSWLAAWRQSTLASRDILTVSLEHGDDPRGTDGRISTWARDRLPAGSILHLDDSRWFAAAASAAAGVHLAQPERAVVWPALAAGSALTLGQPAAVAGVPAPILRTPAAVLAHWQALRGDEQHRRTAGDAARRRFWAERRQVDANLEALMDRVWTW